MSKKSVRPPDADGTGEVHRPSPALVPQIQDHIGRQLRSIYDEILNQPVPDRFRDLMDRLDAPPDDAADGTGEPS